MDKKENTISFEEIGVPFPSSEMVEYFNTPNDWIFGLRVLRPRTNAGLFGIGNREMETGRNVASAASVEENQGSVGIGKGDEETIISLGSKPSPTILEVRGEKYASI